MERALKKPFAPNQRRALSLALSLVSLAGFFGCAGVSIYSAGPMIHHDASSDLSSPAADYKLDDLNGNARALALGARFGEKFMLQVDGRLLDRSWPGHAAPSRGGGAHQEYQFGVGFVFN